MFLRESIWNIWNISCLRAYQIYFDVWGLKARSLGSVGLLLPPLLLNACVHIPVDASAYACDRVMENLYTTCSCVAKTLRVKNTTMFAKESTGHRRHLYRLPSLTVESLTTGLFAPLSASLYKSNQSLHSLRQWELSVVQTGSSCRYSLKPGTSTKDLIIHKATLW